MDYEFSKNTSAWVSIKTTFIDLFSSFGLLGPKYRHDRAERSVQMRLYTLSKRHFVIVFLVFFSSLALSVLIGIAGPAITTSVDRYGSKMYPKPKDMRTGPFKMRSPPLSVFHQQMWLICHVEPSVNRAKQSLSLDIFLDLEGLGKNNKSTMIWEGHELGHAKHRRRTLRCDHQKCAELVLFHLGFLKFPVYHVKLKFNGLENITRKQFDIGEVVFSFRTFNAAFTQFEIWIRFLFLVLTFIAVCMYLHALRRFTIRDWSIEQKWMAVLLPLLLLYNDPILPLTFLVNSWVPSMLDAVFQGTFLSALMLFWLCVYHGIRQNERHFTTFYLPKLIVVGLVWITAIILASWQEYNELRDPTYNYKVDAGNFMAFKIMFFVIGALYVLYLLFLVVRAYAELRTMPYFDLRLKFMTTLMLIVVIVTLTIMALRYGTSLLQDNFVAELSTHYKNSAEFLAFYGLLNFYTYTMAFVYSPSKNAIYESHFKDNPTISMLNDSDEDIVYGSDYEETALMTTNGSAVK